MSVPDQPQTSGVQQLLERIRDEGVGAARREAERILSSAEEEAATLRARARAEAKALLDEAHEKVAVEQQAGREALQLAARDALLELRATIRDEFEAFVKRLVTRETCDTAFLRDLVLVIAGQSAERFLKSRRAQVLLNRDLLEPAAAEVEEESEFGSELSGRTLEISAEVLRDGIELLPSSGLKAGARVRLVDEGLELDLSDEAISRMLMRFLLPRFRHIIDERSAP